MTAGDRFINWVASSRKAIFGGLAVFIGVLAPLSGDGVSVADFLTALAAGVGGGGAVYAVPNEPRLK